MSAITLTLLLPGKSVAVQSWTFDSEPVIRIGRAADNDVVLYSAVVSRHHVEIRLDPEGWKVVNLGANGTYVEGQTIETMPLEDGMIIRMASSGPKIQINLVPDAEHSLSSSDRGRGKLEEHEIQTVQGHRPHPGDSRQTMIS